MDARNFALNMIQRNPRIANNPQAQSMLDAIRNNDTARGEQIASNLCSTYGVTKEQAVNQAKQFFHI